MVLAIMSLWQCVFIRAILNEIRMIKIQATLPGMTDEPETVITPVEQ